MVLPIPWPIFLAGIGTVSAGGAYALTRLFNARRCGIEFDGKCDAECSYGEDPSRCVECLYTCGVPQYEHPFYFTTLFTPRPDYGDGDDDDYDYDYDDDDNDRDYSHRRRGRDRRYGGGRSVSGGRYRRRGRLGKPGESGKPGTPGGRPTYGNNKDEEEDEDEDELQDQMDELSRKDARTHVGGGNASMTDDTRGYRGIILA